MFLKHSKQYGQISDRETESSTSSNHARFLKGYTEDQIQASYIYLAQSNVIAKRFEDSMYLKRAQTLVLSTTVENKQKIWDHQFPLHALNFQKSWSFST